MIKNFTTCENYLQNIVKYSLRILIERVPILKLKKSKCEKSHISIQLINQKITIQILLNNFVNLNINFQVNKIK